MDSMQAWQAESRFWLGGTEGDGRYIFHVHVNEPLPEPVPGSLHTLDAQFERFRCPSGVLWFCGAEYAARDPVAGSKATPHRRPGPLFHTGRLHQFAAWRTRDRHLPRGTAGSGRRCSLASACARRSRHRPSDGRLDAAVADRVARSRPCCVRPGRVFTRQAVPVGDREPTVQRRLAPLPITMAVLIAGIAAVGAGRWLDLRYRRSPRGMEDEAQQLERADFVVSVTLLPAAQFGR